MQADPSELTVAVVIPCRNEEKYIARCIDSVLAQDYPPSLVSIYVCDGLSEDGSEGIARDYEKRFPSVHLLINEKQTTPYALNLGITRSVSDVVIILGAHAELYPDYISNCVSCLNRPDEIDCAGGVIENVYEDTTAGIISTAMSSGFGVGNAHFRTGTREGFVDTVAFGAYRRSIFEKAGLFDDQLIRNQDDEFNYRIHKAGFRIFLSPAIRSKYYVRASYAKLFRQYRQYGYWKVYVNKKHKTITTFRQVIPLVFVLFLFGGIPLSFVHRYFCYLFLSGLGIYFILSSGNAFKKAGKVSWVPGIILTFFLLHFSYGWGYFLGIIDFLLLGKSIRKEEKLTR
jgi:glycosyltransferase involved in cell wall biosynthesis